MAGSTLTPTNLASLQGQVSNFGTAGSTFNGITPNPTPSTTPTPTTVVTSKPAQTNVDNMQTGLTNLQNGVATQAQNNDQTKRTAQQQATLDQTAKLTQDYQDKQLQIQQTKAQTDKATADAKLAAANALGGTNSTQNPNQTGTTNPEQWMQQNDPQSLANFKSANPGVAFTQQDLQNYQSQNSTQNPNQSNTQNNPQYDANTQKINDVNAQLDDQLNQHLQDLSNLRNGTFPLTGSQQAILSTMQTQLQQAVDAQKIANANYVGGVTNAGISSGISRYSPQIAAGEIQNAVSAGITKISDLETNASVAMAKLSDSFQQEDYTEADNNFKEVTDLLGKKTDTLMKMNEDITAAAKDARDFNEKVSEFKQTQAMDQQKQDLEVKKYDLSVQQAGTDDQLKRAQIAKIYSDMSSADTSAASSWVTNIKAGTAKLSDVPANLKNAVSAGLANGNPQGVTSLLSTTKSALDTLNQYVTDNHGFTGAVGFKGPIGTFTGPISGTATADFASKAAQVMNDVVLPNLTILHGLGRVTDREFQALQGSITSLGINTDKNSRFYGTSNLSEPEFKTELKTITDTINQKIQENQPAITGSNVNTALQSGYTPDQIITQLSSDPTMSDKIKQAQQAGYSSQEIVTGLTSLK